MARPSRAAPRAAAAAAVLLMAVACVGGYKTPSSKKPASLHKPDSQKAERPVVQFVTGNPLKTKEIKALLEEDGLTLPFDITTCDIHLPELQEDPTVIAIEKTRLAAQYVGAPVLVEDTSLCFNALGGMPGPYVKWFLDEMGSAGLYKLLDGHQDKTAVAVCNVGFASGPGADPIVFCGQTHGTIVRPKEGKSFGWDNIFRPQGFDRTFADMTVNEKNEISFRSLALRSFQEYIVENWGELEAELRGVGPDMDGFE